MWQLEATDVRWMTVEEVSAYAAVPVTTVKRAMLSGELPAVRLRHNLAGVSLVLRADVERWATAA
jgi:excisionase family DNA binding protein